MGRFTQKQISEGCLRFDDHLTDSVIVYPSTQEEKDEIKTDYEALHKYIMEKYNGDGARLTKEEKKMFMRRVD
jgi:glutamine cyclotransferase